MRTIEPIPTLPENCLLLGASLGQFEPGSLADEPLLPEGPVIAALLAIALGAVFILKEGPGGNDAGRLPLPPPGSREPIAERTAASRASIIATTDTEKDEEENAPAPAGQSRWIGDAEEQGVDARNDERRRSGRWR